MAKIASFWFSLGLRHQWIAGRGCHSSVRPLVPKHGSRLVFVRCEGWIGLVLFGKVKVF